MGNTCTTVADSCWCMAKPIQYCKVKKLKLKIKIKKKQKRKSRGARLFVESHKTEIKQDTHFRTSRPSYLTTLLPKLVSSPRPFLNMILGLTMTQDEFSSEIHYLCQKFLKLSKLWVLVVNRDHKKTSQRLPWGLNVANLEKHLMQCLAHSKCPRTGYQAWCSGPATFIKGSWNWTYVEGGNKQNRLHLESRTPSWARLWSLSYMLSIYGNDKPTGKPDPPGWKSPRARR